MEGSEGKPWKEKRLDDLMDAGREAEREEEEVVVVLKVEAVPEEGLINRP